MRQKELAPDWLEEEYAEIDELILALQTSKDLLVSFSSSPVDLITQIVSDLLIKLRKAYIEEMPMTDIPNPVIIFDERFSDPLGNVLQKEFNRYTPMAYNPPLAHFLYHLAIFFSRSLKPNFKFQKDFHDLLKSMDKFLPPGISTQKSVKAEKKQNQVQVRTKQKVAVESYYRRRRKNK